MSKLLRDFIKSTSPEFLDFLIEKAPYKIPKPFPMWSRIAEQAVIPLRIFLERDELGNHIENFHAMSWKYLVLDNHPVYCISKSIIRDFEMTEIRESEPFLPKDWVPRLANFMLIFPDSVVQDPEGQSILYTFVSTCPPHNTDPTLISKCGVISAMSSDGLIYSTNFKIGANGEILNNEELQPGSMEVTDEDKVFLKKLRAIVIQSLLCLEYAPQYVEDAAPAVSSQSKNKTTKNGPEVWSPRTIGLNYQRRLGSISTSTTSETTSDRKSPRTHQRMAHWRSQACGKGSRDRVARWIMPTVVNNGKN